MTRLMQSARFCAAVAVFAGLQFATSQILEAARPLTKTKYDPSAEQIDMFEGMESGQIEVKMIAKDALGGNLLLKNETEEPLTVKVPAGFVGVPTLAQFDDFGGGGTTSGGSSSSGGGQNQAIGGGGGGGLGGGGFGGGGGGFGGGGGGGFFSIPPKKTLSVPFKSVCLEHGKPEPHPKTPYTVIPVEKYTKDPVLTTLIQMVGTGKLSDASAQAAAWNIANGMSWQELAMKKYDRVAAPDTPYFSRQQLMAAQQVVAAAQHIVEEGGLEMEPVEPRSDRVRRAAR